jgi:hypothetical protein
MSHDARTDVTAEDDQHAAPSWWENQVRVDVPRTRDAYQGPAQRSTRNLHDGQRPSPAAVSEPVLTGVTRGSPGRGTSAVAAER